jgi:hypothetical protein
MKLTGRNKKNESPGSKAPPEEKILLHFLPIEEVVVQHVYNTGNMIPASVVFRVPPPTFPTTTNLGV